MALILGSIPGESQTVSIRVSNDPIMRCSMTGLPIRDSGDGIWEDGEWISWAYINQYIDEGEESDAEVGATAVAATEPIARVEPQGAELLALLLDAIAHGATSPDPSPLWGRIGELYAAERFGVELTKTHTQGHDGRLGHDHVEIKTITPTKKRRFVTVKRAGNFNLLAVVCVDDNYQLDARLVSRAKLPEGNGGSIAVVSWRTACLLGSPFPPSPAV
jgi:hypothetical protein